MAILVKNEKLANKLISAGSISYININSNTKDLSPIFLAAENEYTDLLEIMCDHGAKLEVTNSKGQTPLMFASQLQKQDIVNYLTLRIKDLNTEDTHCLTILMHQL